jgi:ribosome-associated protein
MKSSINFLDLAKQAAKIADDKKASDILVLNVKKVTTLADYFVIATAESNAQISAIIEAVQKAFKERGVTAIHRDGIGSTSWSVLDFGGLVLHIMRPETRELYALEKHWSDGKVVSPES